jgi:hypothetical protein
LEILLHKINLAFWQQKVFPQFQKHDVFAKCYNILLDEAMLSGLLRAVE